MTDTHFTALTDILVGKLKVPHDQITMEVTPDEIGMDSLAMVELSILLEQELGITVSDSEIADALSVGDIVSLMQERSVSLS